MTRGVCSIGLSRPKSHHNVGSVLRAAHCFGADMVAIEGDRTFIRSHVDTPKTYKNLPVLQGEDLSKMMPYGAVPIAVDLVEDAEDLITFQHPRSAFYVFGPEDGTLGDHHLEWCQKRLMIPTRGCINLAAAVNVILYDRMAKFNRMSRGLSVLSKLEAAE